MVTQELGVVSITSLSMGHMKGLCNLYQNPESFYT